ncbi:hypothetical protein [Hyphobacterium marinum]|uniref:Uncharacterized protein n=1 Tax=Hyphobacterium marinum TaxID=3116574 RepID=A0ABU7M0Y0_9PROT|nr:hypothetical protein [Hyphobacterium sp. Y6023]MEE2567477.1 hypothetical protein [Hyphobacterium sp. Y6023]
MMAILMASLVLAFATALTSGVLVIRAGVLDHPNARSSHERPTPRGGGLAVMAGVGLGGLLLALTGQAGLDLVPVLGAALAAGALGLADDLFALGAKEKFAILLAISLSAAFAIGPVTVLDFGPVGLPLGYWIGIGGSALWIFTAANAVNFMDGSDGLIAAALIPASVGLGLVSGEMTGFLLAASMAGFLYWNRPRAKLFLGDAGSLFAGTLFASAALAAVNGPGGVSVWIAPLLVLPLLADVLLTLAAKLRAKKRLSEAHRSHAYQLRLRMGESHLPVAAFFAFSGLMIALASFSASRIGGVAPILTFLVMTATFSWYQVRVRARAKASGLDLTE